MSQHRIIQGDVLRGLASLPDESIQTVVTSPPYWGLRDYSACSCAKQGRLEVYEDERGDRHTRGGAIAFHRIKEHDPNCPLCHGTGYDETLRNGQIGLEPTPEEYVEKMVRVFREVKRVLRKDGTVWLNMGDCYACSPVGNFRGGGPLLAGRDLTGHAQAGQMDKVEASGCKPKDLVGMPWRLAFALQADGWWLRSDIVWSKPNPMPESVTDRPTKSHEYLFLLTKDARYFYDADAIREEGVTKNMTGHNITDTRLTHGSMSGGNLGFLKLKEKYHELGVTTLGRNRRTVWEIPTQPYPEAHFATFPEALVEPCIRAGTSGRGACPGCGSPWERVVEKGEQIYTGNGGVTSWKYHDCQMRSPSFTPHHIIERKEVGWSPTCTCGAEVVVDGEGVAETVPCVVLDPFGGSGTVAKVARDLGRSSVSIELNPAYVELMKKRLRYYEQLTPEVRVETMQGF
jgi:DNA modification methylase